MPDVSSLVGGVKKLKSDSDKDRKNIADSLVQIYREIMIQIRITLSSLESHHASNQQQNFTSLRSVLGKLKSYFTSIKALDDSLGLRNHSEEMESKVGVFLQSFSVNASPFANSAEAVDNFKRSIVTPFLKGLKDDIKRDERILTHVEKLS